MPRVKVAPTLVLFLSAVASYVALRPVLGLGHELAVAALAWTFHIAVGTDAWEPVVRLLGLDPIYAGAAIRAAGAERPIGFQQQWTVIRSRPDIVLGGMAYTWATNGPEDLDRVFGLVDATGVPTDGALAALGGSYLAETVGDAPSRNN